MKSREVKGKARRLQSPKVSRGREYSVGVSRTIGWTMMDGEERSKCGAATVVVLPATDYYNPKYRFPPSKCSVFNTTQISKQRKKYLRQ